MRRRRSSRTYADQHSRYGGDRGSECTGDSRGGRDNRGASPGYDRGTANRYAGTYEYTDADQHTDAHADSNTDAHADSHQHSNTDPNKHAGADLDSNTDTHADTHQHSNTGTDSDASADGYQYAYTDQYANAHSRRRQA